MSEKARVQLSRNDLIKTFAALYNETSKPLDPVPHKMNEEMANR